MIIEKIVKLTELFKTHIFGTELKRNLSGVEDLVRFDDNFV